MYITCKNLTKSDSKYFMDVIPFDVHYACVKEKAHLYTDYVMTDIATRFRAKK